MSAAIDHANRQQGGLPGRRLEQHLRRHAGPAIAAGALAACLWPAPARADVEYVYTGNAFPLTQQSLVIESSGYVHTVTTVTPTFIRAVIDSPVALQAGTAFGAGLSFTLSRYDEIIAGAPTLIQTLYAPYPFSGPFDPPGSTGNPNQVVTFSIGAVDGAGLPTDWNLSIAQSIFPPTGREITNAFETSTTLDSMSGGYQGFYMYSGSLAGSPGSWSVSVVPEAGAASLLLAGLGALGLALGRGRRGMAASGNGTAAG